MMTQAEFDNLNRQIDMVANRETDHVDENEFNIDRDENGGISIVLNPTTLDLEPEDEE